MAGMARSRSWATTSSGWPPPSTTSPDQTTWPAPWLTPAGLWDGERLAPLAELRRAQTWSEEMQEAVEETLPPYRLSMVQRALPKWVQREILAGYLLDWAEAVRVVIAAT